MKILAGLIAMLAFTGSVSALTISNLFEATLEMSLRSPGEDASRGRASLKVDLDSRAWQLEGSLTISNLNDRATSAEIAGPAGPGQIADTLFDLILSEPIILLAENNLNTLSAGRPYFLSGGGVFTSEQLDWLHAGLLYVNVRTGGFPEGEIRGQLLAVLPTPEAGATVTYVLIAGLGMCVFGRFKRFQRHKDFE